MNVKKPMIIAALIAGNLLACNLALQAADTNTPPSTPPAGAPPTGPRPGGMMRGGPSLDQLAQQLNLTDDQKTKVKSILDAQQQKIRDLRTDTSVAPENRRAKVQSIREETSTQMKAALTPEQFEKWQKMGPRGPRPGGPNGMGTNAPAGSSKN